MMPPPMTTTPVAAGSRSSGVIGVDIGAHEFSPYAKLAIIRCTAERCSRPRAMLSQSRIPIIDCHRSSRATAVRRTRPDCGDPARRGGGAGSSSWRGVFRAAVPGGSRVAGGAAAPVRAAARPRSDPSGARNSMPRTPTSTAAGFRCRRVSSPARKASTWAPDVAYGSSVVLRRGSTARSDAASRGAGAAGLARIGGRATIVAWYKISQALMRSIARSLALGGAISSIEAFDRGPLDLAPLRYPMRTDAEQAAAAGSERVGDARGDAILHDRRSARRFRISDAARAGRRLRPAGAPPQRRMDRRPAHRRRAGGQFRQGARALERGRIKATEHRVIGSGERENVHCHFSTRRARTPRSPAAHGCGGFVRAVSVRRLSVGDDYTIRRIQGYGKAASAATRAKRGTPPGSALERLGFRSHNGLTMPVRRRVLEPRLARPVSSALRRLALVTRLALDPWGRRQRPSLLLAGACLLVPHSVRRSDRSAWVGLTAMGFFSTLFVMTLLRDSCCCAPRVLLGAAAYAALLGPSAIDTRRHDRASPSWASSIARRPRTRERRHPHRAAAEALHGFSIAQISDVHVGPTIRRGFVERLVRAREWPASRPHRGDRRPGRRIGATTGRRTRRPCRNSRRVTVLTS